MFRHAYSTQVHVNICRNIYICVSMGMKAPSWHWMVFQINSTLYLLRQVFSLRLEFTDSSLSCGISFLPPTPLPPPAPIAEIQATIMPAWLWPRCWGSNSSTHTCAAILFHWAIFPARKLLLSPLYRWVNWTRRKEVAVCYSASSHGPAPITLPHPFLFWHKSVSSAVQLPTPWQFMVAFLFSFMNTRGESIFPDWLCFCRWPTVRTQ